MTKHSQTHLDNASHELVEDHQGSVIRVRDGDGINLELTSRMQYSPTQVYNILTDPAADKVFRSITACTNRKILEEDKKQGKRKISISHKAISRFLFISVTFETHLFVWEDDRAHTIRFQNAREGFMKRFEGSWKVHGGHHFPVSAYKPAPSKQLSVPMDNKANPFSALQNLQPPSWLNPGNVMAAAQRLFPMGASDSSVVTLEQHIMPAHHPPGYVTSLIKRLVSKQLKDMMEDLRNELERRHGTAAVAEVTHHHRPAPALAKLPVTTACITQHAHDGLPRLLDGLWANTEPLINITVEL